MIPYSFLFTRKCRECLFPKEILIYYEKTIPRSLYFLGNYDWGVANKYLVVIFYGEYIFTVKTESFQVSYRGKENVERKRKHLNFNQHVVIFTVNNFQ